MNFASSGQDVQATDESDYTPNLVTYQIVFNFEALVGFQTRKISSSLRQRFCSQWSDRSRNTLVSAIGSLQDPATWYRTTRAGTQVVYSGTSKTKQLVPVHLDLGLPFFGSLTVQLASQHVWLSTISIHNLRSAGRVNGKTFTPLLLMIDVSCHFFFVLAGGNFYI